MSNSPSRQANNDEAEDGERTMLALSAAEPLTVPLLWHFPGFSLEYHAQPPGECSLHVPRHTLCLPLLPGAVERRISGHVRAGTVERGSSSIYPADSTQWVRWLVPMEFLFVSLEPTLLAQAIDPAHAVIELMERLPDVHDELLTQMGLALQHECMVGPNRISQSYVDALIHALAAHLVRHHAVNAPVDVARHITLSAQHVRRVIEYMHAHLNTALPLAELAALVGMSSAHFVRAFHAAVGQSPHQYILLLRIQEAQRLLIHEDHTLSEIALRLGFADHAHFSRTFKRIIGMAPSVFQHQQRTNEHRERNNLQDV